MDHDQRFKVLLQEFFFEFMALFFPHWVDRFDFSRVEWLKQELFVNPPRGEKGAVDLIAKVSVREPVKTAGAEGWLVLVHLEVESADKVAPFRRRVFEYYERLRRDHDLPVLPIAVFLRVGLDGIGWDVYTESFWEHQLLCFEYAYIGLSALDAEHYVIGENILGVALAALMRVSPERRLWLKQQAFERLAKSTANDARRYLLYDCVDAYLPLEGPDLAQFVDWLARKPEQEMKTVGTTLRQLYGEEGKLLGQRELLQLMLEDRFGPLSPLTLQRLEALAPEKVSEVALAVNKVQSLQELGLAD